MRDPFSLSFRYGKVSNVGVSKFPSHAAECFSAIPRSKETRKQNSETLALDASLCQKPKEKGSWHGSRMPYQGNILLRRYSAARAYSCVHNCTMYNSRSTCLYSCAYLGTTQSIYDMCLYIVIDKIAVIN
jgi:hypothetical protein